MSSTTTTTTTTTVSEKIPRGPISATLTFYSPPSDNSPPYNYVETPPPGHPQRNYNEHPQSVPLTDIRTDNGAETTLYTLDKDAFQVLTSIPTNTTYETFASDTHVKKSYYPEVESLLLSALPGATKVIIFDHTIRRNLPNASRGPVHRAHVDQTAKAAAERVRLHAGEDEAERIFAAGTRYRIVNVWKPLNGPVESEPLAFASADSVDDDTDLVPVQHRYPHRTGETMAVKYNVNQRWMYLSGMKDDERLLLKCSDTKEDVGKRVPHTAFSDPRTGVDAKPRESIEVRALVFG